MDDPLTEMLDKAISEEPETFAGFDRTKNVQDQLQEMMIDEKDSEDKYIVLLDNFLGWVLNDYTGLDWAHCPSIDQLWLGFVMKKHNKTWDGKKWVKE